MIAFFAMRGDLLRWKLAMFVGELLLCDLGRRHHRESWDGYMGVSSEHYAASWWAGYTISQPMAVAVPALPCHLWPSAWKHPLLLPQPGLCC